MKYSELIDAFQEQDDARVNKILKELTPRLLKFLRIHMGADPDDAKDAVQQAFADTLDVLREGRLQDPEKLLTYLMTASRNIYLKKSRSEVEINHEMTTRHHFQVPQQLKKLLEKEKFEILEECLDELNEDYRTFIDYWFAHPDSETREIAEHFGITRANSWTRKHRIINKLNECYKKKSNL